MDHFMDLEHPRATRWRATSNRGRRDCLLARTKQNWNFLSSRHIALQNREKLAHPTRFERVTPLPSKGNGCMPHRHLHQRFDLIYCTGTGIIAASIALGHPVDEILELYKSPVVEVMKCLMPGKRRQRSKLWPRMCSNTKTSRRQRPASASCQLDQRSRRRAKSLAACRARILTSPARGGDFVI